LGDFSLSFGDFFSKTSGHPEQESCFARPSGQRDRERIRSKCSFPIARLPIE